MTGRHAGQLTPTDTWLTDQLHGWISEVERFFDECAAAGERTSSLTIEQVWQQTYEQSVRKSVLLFKVRHLVTEVLRRG